ncbi:MAG: hypothetical protein JSW58_08455 [Candidatus Latescibacterota bacterium]|nr:MAG: hypothetical protein JSW58_08455 [Candidatus Latescibacterota bacterium]
MAFTAPSLVTEIDGTNYEYEINLNFRRLQTALTQIQNELGVTIGNAAPSNLLLVDLLLGRADEGMLGTSGWALSFQDSTDGLSVVITHPTNDASYCVINGLLHKSEAGLTYGIENALPGGDGVYRVVVGVTSLGAPAVEYVIENAEGATDESADLTLWSFDAVVSSGIVTDVRNLRRETTVLADRSAWDNIYGHGETLSFGVEGALGGSPANLQPGIIVPWDCEIVQAYFNLGTAPASGLTVKLRKDETDEDVLASTVSWSAAETGVKSAAGTDPTTLVAAGTFLQAEMTAADASAADLSVTVEVRRIHHALSI